MDVRALASKNFTLIFLGQLVSQIGTALYVIAIVFWLKEATHSASMVSLLLTLSVIPGIVLGPLFGAFADRYSRRNLIALSDFLTGCLILSTGLLMYSMPGRKDLVIGVLPLVIVLKGTFWAIFQTSLKASVPDIVPMKALTSANSLLDIAFRVSELVGQFLGGILLVTLGASAMMFVNGLCFLLSALSAFFLKLPAHAKQKHVRGWRHQIRAFRTDIIEGLRFVRGLPGLAPLMVVAAASKFYYGPLVVLLPFFIEKKLDLTPDWYGFLMGALTAGTLVGGAFSGFTQSLKSKGKVVVIALFVCFATLIYLSYSQSGVMVALSLLVTGICSGATSVMLISALQRSTPTHIRGRVFGVSGMVSSTLVAASIGFSGIVADMLNRNVALIYTCCGILGLAAPVCLLFSRAFHLIDASDDCDVPERGVSSRDREVADLR